MDSLFISIVSAGLVLRYLGTVVHLPLDQLNGNEVVAITAVEEDEAVSGRGLELKEEVHGGVGLEGGQAQVAALGLEGDRVGDDVPQSKASLQFAVVDVSVFAQVDKFGQGSFSLLDSFFAGFKFSEAHTVWR